jgi:hypothetical protein
MSESIDKDFHNHGDFASVFQEIDTAWKGLTG